MAKPKRNSAKELKKLKKLDHFARKFSRRAWFQERDRRGTGERQERELLRLHIYENTPEKLKQLPPKS